MYTLLVFLTLSGFLVVWLKWQTIAEYRDLLRAGSQIFNIDIALVNFIEKHKRLLWIPVILNLIVALIIGGILSFIMSFF